MNIKSMIAAAAVAASTVASASIFNWTITANEGSTLTKGSLASYKDDTTWIRTDDFWTANNGTKASGSLNESDWGYKYEDGTLKGWNGSTSSWLEVGKFSFGITGKINGNTEKTGGTDILWSDVLAAWKDDKAYSKTFWYGGDNGDALSGTISITPEPTSGLLLLLGTGMLALRRKAVRA